MNGNPAQPRSFHTVLVLLLWAWLVSVLVLNLPGHLTHDSITQIAEGRSGWVRSWNPVFGSWLFGTLVAWTGGTEVLVAVSASLLAGAVYLLCRSLPQPSLWGLVALGVWLFGPILLIHPGTVWKDVWFAHLGLLGFGFIALRAQGAGWWAEGLALLLLAAAMLSRQTGLLVSITGVGALALLTCRPAALDDTAAGRWLLRLGLRFALGLLMLFSLAGALGALAKSQMKEIQAGEVGTGLKLVAMFDIAGMLHRDPSLRLERLQAQGFETRQWEAGAKATFSPERIDKLDMRGMTGPRELSGPMVLAQWAALIAANPLTYAAHRLEVYAWFGGLRDQAQCIPVHVGIDASPLTPDAGIKLSPARLSSSLYQWSRAFVDTPYFAPLFWSACSAITALLLALGRQWRQPVLWLQVAGLVYSASYLIAGFSCDFRYSYFSVVAASLGIAYLFCGGYRPMGSPENSPTATPPR